MFRKLVSNLSFSPALVGQLAFYAQRLKKEEATRRLGLIFTALALIIQSFAVFQPPESANAAHPSNFVNGGVANKDQFISLYDSNVNNIRDLMNQVGITKKNLQQMEAAPHYSKGKYSWGLTERFSAAQGERSYDVATADGGKRTFYYRPLEIWDNGGRETRYDGWVGHSSTGQWFAISKACGNLILKDTPPAPPKPTPAPAPAPAPAPVKKCDIPGKTHLPLDSSDCKKDETCTVEGLEHLPKDDSRCRTVPAAFCTTLSVDRIVSGYRFDTKAYAKNLEISSYVYTIKKDGKVIDTIEVPARDSPTGRLANSYIYTQNLAGNYTVEATVTPKGEITQGPRCVKSFEIAPPQKCPFNSALPITSPECQPCPGDTTLWIKHPECHGTIVQTKKAINTSQGNKDAVATVAKTSDRIVYNLTIENIGKSPTNFAIKEKLDDVLEYATILDNGGGTFNDAEKLLTWPEITLGPGEKQSRMFTIQVLNQIPSMGTSPGWPSSYDCKMTNTFGNSLAIDVECPVQKQIVEQTVAELPKTGPGMNVIFAGVTLTLVAYFYARSRQMKQEVRLIRRSYNAGTI